jgi:hypothetical protein
MILTDKKSLERRNNIENIKILNHRLNNILGFSESSMNRLKNAGINTMKRRWITMRDVIIVTGRDRIEKEIELYREIKTIIEKVSEEIYVDICKQLLKADKYYKAMFDQLDNSDEYSEKDKNITLTNGDKMIGLLKDTINKLEAIKIGLRKI